jgi:iron complex transport system ATP-binding protein
MERTEPSGFLARGLALAYGARRALDGIDLEARSGELVGVLGPNGSGKSTLVRILGGALAHYEGAAAYEGRELRDIPRRELARALAVVQQEPGFGFPFTALEIVLMGRHPHLAGTTFESPRDIELAHAALERCGAAAFAGRPIDELSSGERQRVVFARALCQEARFLLLDEPASFLDVRHQVGLYDIVREQVDERGCGAITVLHELNLAAEYCDRIYLLRDGRVEAQGPTEEVFTYANLRRVFDTEIYVERNSLTGRLLVAPLPGRVQRRLDRE